MKKEIKITLIILGVLVGIIVLDTFQARIFKNSPIISWQQNVEGGYVDKGLLMDTYYCQKEQDPVNVSYHFKISKFSCPAQSLNTNNKTLDDLYSEINDIRKIDKNYSLEQAQKDKCLVISNNSIYNEFISDDFMSNYNQQKDAFMRIAQTTIEGDVILTDVIYLAKDNKVYLVLDFTRDRFSDDTIDIHQYEKIQENETNWVLYNGNEKDINSDNSFTIEKIFKNLHCLKSQIGGYITSEKISPKEISLKELLNNDDLKNIKYSYALKNSLNQIALIINTNDEDTVSTIEKLLTNTYKNIQKAKFKENYYIYVDNGHNDFDLEEDLTECLK